MLAAPLLDRSRRRPSSRPRAGGMRGSPAPSPTTATFFLSIRPVWRARSQRLPKSVRRNSNKRSAPVGRSRLSRPPRARAPRRGWWCRDAGSDACRSGVSTTRCTPKKLRVVSMMLRPGCQAAVAMNAHDCERGEPRGVAPPHQHQPDQHPPARPETGSPWRSRQGEGRRRTGRSKIASAATPSAGEMRHKRLRRVPFNAPGIASSVAMIRIGYSSVWLNRCGASRPAKMPPITPPNEVQIELGEQRRRRTARVNFAMTCERQRKQRKQVEPHRGKPVFAVAAEQRDGKRRHHERHDLDDEVVREPRLSRNTATKVSR